LPTIPLLGEYDFFSIKLSTIIQDKSFRQILASRTIITPNSLILREIDISVSLSDSTANYEDKRILLKGDFNLEFECGKGLIVQAKKS